MAMRLLPGERIEAELRPHVLSFGPQFFVALLPALWAVFLLWLFQTEGWNVQDANPSWWQFWVYLYGNAWSGHVLAVLGLAALGAVVAVVGIRWRVFFLFVAWALLAVGVTVWLGNDGYRVLLPVMLALGSVPGVLSVEWNRRSHHYTLTNLRIVFRGGALVRRERQMRYEGVTDLDVSQGPFGKIFGYGTIIPVTQSGFGLGEDSSEAGIAVGGGGQKGGAMVGAAITAGGGKSVQTGRARTFHQLTGVHPFGDMKFLLERLIQEATSTPYLREQVELQRRMVDALERVEGGQ